MDSNIKIKVIKSSDVKNLQAIKEIYFDSFPITERVDFDVLKNCKFPNSKLFGVFYKKLLIGFVFVSEFDTLLYIVYFAIDKKYRNHNYGTNLMQILIKKHRKKFIALCVEKAEKVKDEKYKRINFYKRNGFEISDFKFDYLGQTFYTMYYGKFDKKKFKDFLLVCFPKCKNFKKIVNTNIVKFEKVNTHNLKDAIRIQQSIFPLENGSEDLKDAIKGTLPSYHFLHTYWLAKVKNKYVGICGLYAYKFAPKDAWLGWYGVIESERQNGYGSEILYFVIQQAKKLGFENFRLYTDEKDNKNSHILYRKFGMKSEIYDNKHDEHFQISNTLIFSKSLVNKKVKLWNNKNMHLNEHDKKNSNKKQ